MTLSAQHVYIKELTPAIKEFIAKHHILTLATSYNNIPYCCTCFYIYNKTQNYFIITSDKKTRHIQEIMMQPIVSWAIALETSMVGKLQGLQFTGVIKEVDKAELNKEKYSYIKRFPIASLAELQLWRMDPDFIKFTDNQLGFGKKMIWEKEKLTGI